MVSPASAAAFFCSSVGVSSVSTNVAPLVPYGLRVLQSDDRQNGEVALCAVFTSRLEGHLIAERQNHVGQIGRQNGNTLRLRGQGHRIDGDGVIALPCAGLHIVTAAGSQGNQAQKASSRHIKAAIKTNVQFFLFFIAASFKQVYGSSTGIPRRMRDSASAINCCAHLGDRPPRAIAHISAPLSNSSICSASPR